MAPYTSGRNVAIFKKASAIKKLGSALRKNIPELHDFLLVRKWYGKRKKKF